jgi:hypothetical protein
MGYKWTPSRAQRREFAQRMNDSQFAAEYYARKNKQAAKRRSTSKFDYPTAGGYYIPTREQYDAANTFLLTGHLDDSQEDACNQVIYGYTCQERVHHDKIHIVNELRRNNGTHK